MKQKTNLFSDEREREGQTISCLGRSLALSNFPLSPSHEGGGGMDGGVEALVIRL